MKMTGMVQQGFVAPDRDMRSQAENRIQVKDKSHFHTGVICLNKQIQGVCPVRVGHIVYVRYTYRVRLLRIIETGWYRGRELRPFLGWSSLLICAPMGVY